MADIQATNVNLELLQEQKRALVRLLWDLPADHICWGLVELLDSIEDQMDRPVVLRR